MTTEPERNLQDEAGKCTGYCNPRSNLRPGKLEPSPQGGMRCSEEPEYHAEEQFTL